MMARLKLLRNKMAYRCTKYNKILVGPKKTCEICEIGNLESECEYRVWQEGVLKEGGKRTRGVRREIWPLGISGLGFFYTLGDDGNYHCRSPKPSGTTRNRSKITKEWGILVLETLTPEEMSIVKKDRRNYFELLKQKGLLNQ